MIDMNKYKDIINLPHHEPVLHPRMPRAKRAMLFIGFRALQGHKELLEKTAKEQSSKFDELGQLKSEQAAFDDV